MMRADGCPWISRLVSEKLGVSGGKLTTPTAFTSGLCLRRCALPRRDVSGAVEIESRGQEMVGLVAEIDRHQMEKAPQHPSGADQEEEGEGDLGDDEETLRREPRSGFCRCAMQGSDDVCPGAS
jgi:hypothetical protein